MMSTLTTLTSQKSHPPAIEYLARLDIGVQSIGLDKVVDVEQMRDNVHSCTEQRVTT